MKKKIILKFWKKNKKLLKKILTNKTLLTNQISVNLFR